MLIAKIQNNQVLEIAEYKSLFPEVSFPSTGPDLSWMKDNSVLPITMFKSYDSDTQKLVQAEPYIEGDEVFTVAVVEKSEEEIAADTITKLEQLKSSIVQQVQSNLDAFARTKNYDSILSAASYAASSNPVFKSEGQTAVVLRDDTWAKLYTILAEVEAGTRTVTSFADIEAELPVLEWV